MSHIGSKEIKIPANVTIELVGNKITVKGKNGSLSLVHKNILVDLLVENNARHIIVKPYLTGAKKSDKQASILWGTYRTLIDNMVTGVSQGYSKSLSLVGVGYKANMLDKHRLSLKVGYSIDLLYNIPSDIKIECPKPDLINIYGIDKQRVNQVAAEIRAYREPEPYKGKGIRYVGEIVRTKEGKKK
uniref:Ribosomal protein L6 n=1 Tax=Histiona aroides TaxID=392300 RepID=M4Q9L0_HISAR|nr:ribosomal protein L6 [Histiona aroides]AGH24056.1 ribosomal protein L6 [Histiona aroides]